MNWGHGEGYLVTHTYDSLDELIGKEELTWLKKTRAKVYAWRDEDMIKIRLHETDIMTYYPDNVVELNSGGWRTKLTKDRINDLLPKPWRLSQVNGIWYINRWDDWDGQEWVFEDGMLIDVNNMTISGDGDDRKIIEDRKRIKAYARKFAQAFLDGDVPAPSNGDCWFCWMLPTDDADHLDGHMDEDYFVPSLLVKAFEFVDTPPMAKHIVQNFWTTGEFIHPSWNDWVSEWINKAVKKYMLHKFGYPC